MRPDLLTPVMLILQGAWFLAPGLLLALALLRRKHIASYYVVPVAALVGCLLGYAAFWIYFASLTAGRAFGLISLGLSTVCAALLVLVRANRQLLRTVDVAAPLVLLYLVTLFYTSVTFSCAVAPTVSTLESYCHLSSLTGDNIMPQIFADNLLHGDVKALIFGWQGSDRPPLQSGVVLLQGLITESTSWHLIGYELIAVLLQALWVPAVWAFCRALRLSGRALVTVLTLCVFTGFLFFNSVFTWPKLLAASMTLLATAFLVFAKPSRWTWAMGGLAVGTAMVAHSGIFFTLVPLVAVLLRRRFRPNWKLLGLAAVAAALLLAPWQAYQTFYDPPGDRLLKEHLAGYTQADDAPLITTIVNAYTDTPKRVLLENKLNNVTQVFALPNERSHRLGVGRTGTLRDEEIRYVVIGLGLFNLGWLALFWRSVRLRLRDSLDMARLKLILTLAGGALLFWLLAMFGPPIAITVLFQGSYATMLLLYVGLGAVITVLPRRLVRVLLGIQIGYFMAIWVVAAWQPYRLQPVSVAFSAVSVVAVLAVLGALGKRISTTPEDPQVPASQPAVAPAVGAVTG
jgi:hypothetical protein